MEKIKNFIKKYKAEIIIALGAIASIATSLIAVPGTNGKVCAIIIAIVGICVEALKSGFSQATIDLIAKAVLLIVELIQKETKEEAISASKPLTIEEIKAKLLEE